MATPRFKVGDVCTIVNCTCCPGKIFLQHAGLEITIVSVDPNDLSGYVYETDIPAPEGHYWARECFLRLKRPPRQDTVRWQDCEWQPERECV